MEKWKDIRDTGWKVSDLGNIMKPNGKVIQFRTDGYRECEVGKVHKLVATYFCNPPEDTTGWCVHHKNKIPSDNRAENLVWMRFKDHQELHTKDRREHPKKKTPKASKDVPISRELIYNYLNSLREC